MILNRRADNDDQLVQIQATLPLPTNGNNRRFFLLAGIERENIARRYILSEMVDVNTDRAEPTYSPDAFHRPDCDRMPNVDLLR